MAIKIDVKNELRKSVESGKIIIGTKNSKKAILNGIGKLIIVSNSLTNEDYEEIKYLSELSNIPLYEFDGNSYELGIVCGKPFAISLMVIKEEGKSALLKGFKK